MSILIPSGLKTIYHQSCDALIDFWHKDVIIVYEPTEIACINCTQDTMPGLGISTSQYKAGGPIPFTVGICPYCQGNGYTYTEHIEVIPMIVYNIGQKSYNQINLSINIPAGTIYTRFIVNYLPQIQQCKEIRLAQGTADYQTKRFIKLSEPVFFGLDNRYITMSWQPFRGAT